MGTEPKVDHPIPPPMRVIRSGGWLTKFTTAAQVRDKVSTIEQPAAIERTAAIKMDRPVPPPMRIIRDGGWLTKFTTAAQVRDKL